MYSPVGVHEAFAGDGFHFPDNLLIGRRNFEASGNPPIAAMARMSGTGNSRFQS
jgi:hypothetical protein